MGFKRHIYPILIREHHLDTFGHVNNATYLQLFEEARWELITQNGYGLDVVRKSGLGPIILEIQVKFLKELRLRTSAQIETYGVSYEGKIFLVRQDIKDAQGELYCTADFKSGFFDTRERKLIPPTPEWLKAIGMEA